MHFILDTLHDRHSVSLWMHTEETHCLQRGLQEGKLRCRHSCCTLRKLNGLTEKHTAYRDDINIEKVTARLHLHLHDRHTRNRVYTLYEDQTNFIQGRHTTYRVAYMEIILTLLGAQNSQANPTAKYGMHYQPKPCCKVFEDYKISHNGRKQACHIIQPRIGSTGYQQVFQL